METGLLTTQCEEILLYRVRDLSLRITLGQRIFGVGTVTITKNVPAKKNEIYIPVVLPQGTIKEVHKAAGFEENGL